jgi:hypothetical protein
MTAISDLVARSVDLKRQLLEYANLPRFDRAIRHALEERFGPVPLVDEGELANFLDWFVLEERLKDGRTVVERFVADHPELPDDERAMLLGWRDVVSGIFEVGRRDGEALIVVNLVDELTYRVRANVGPAIFSQMPRRSFLIGRLVPIGDEWLLSGASNLLPASSKTEVYQMAVELTSRFPALVFRNPEKLAQAWELQREERRYFVDYFGTDLVVLPGRKLVEQMQAYDHYRAFEARNAEGRTVAERTREAYGVEPRPQDFPWPDDFITADSIGMIYDEQEGLTFLMNFAVVEQTFANPELAADRRHQNAVHDYLTDESISPLVFRRLAQRDPERASQVFQRILKQPRFSWERDGEALLRKHKASFFEQPPLPSIMPVSDRLARVARAAPDPDLPRPDYRPARRRKESSRPRKGWSR